MKIKESIFSWLTHPYHLIIKDEENFAERKQIPYTNGKLIAIVVPILIILMLFTFWFGTKISGTTYSNDGHSIRKKVVMLSVSVDSLSEVISMNEQYYKDFRKVMKADHSRLRPDTTRILSVQKPDSQDMSFLPKVDQELRREFEGKFNLSGANESSGNSLDDMYFFPPLKGIISEAFSSKSKHYGTDIVTKKNEPIKSISDGTVILSSWTDDTGNVIAIQHQSNIISLYKHNSALLKKVGDVVKAGEVIAIVGNTGKYSSGPHLHFELWYNGNPINPERFVSF